MLKIKVKTMKTKQSSSKKVDQVSGAGKAVLTVLRTGGASRSTGRQRATLLGLGLKKRHQVRKLEDTPSVRGMLKKVEHLVQVIVAN